MAYLRRVAELDLERAFFEGSYNGKGLLVFPVLGARTSFSGTTAYEDLAEFLTGTTLPTPTGAESWEVVSSSANDAAAGTGVRSVKIVYLDNSWLLQSTTATLNGTTPVAVAALANCQAIQWMHSATLGSGGVAAGNIDLRIAGGGTVHERVTAGGNKSMTCRFTVPDGYFATVDYWGEGVGTSHSQNSRLRATADPLDGTLISGVFLFQDVLFLDNASDARFVGPFHYHPRVQIKISTITANITADVAASMRVRLQEI